MLIQWELVGGWGGGEERFRWTRVFHRKCFLVVIQGLTPLTLQHTKQDQGFSSCHCLVMLGDSKVLVLIIPSSPQYAQLVLHARAVSGDLYLTNRD